jgi:ADP-ribose pyrophosphatase YjhB (NUDIX family)
LKVPIEKSEYIPIAVKAGFAFHHAEARYVMLTTWLSQDENHLPPNASHQVGVGCVVVSPDKKLLLVQERNGPLKGTGIWKLPTGLVDAGEDIAEAARREVMEETGIETEFTSTLCFRQAHNMQFGKSDLFFVCLLRPTSSEIAHQQTEIHACEWKDPEHLFDQEFFKESELHRKVNSLIQDSIDSAAADTTNGRAIEMVKLDIGFRPGQNTLHYVAKQSR